MMQTKQKNHDNTSKANAIKRLTPNKQPMTFQPQNRGQAQVNQDIDTTNYYQPFELSPVESIHQQLTAITPARVIQPFIDDLFDEFDITKLPPLGAPADFVVMEDTLSMKSIISKNRVDCFHDETDAFSAFEHEDKTPFTEATFMASPNGVISIHNPLNSPPTPKKRAHATQEATHDKQKQQRTKGHGSTKHMLNALKDIAPEQIYQAVKSTRSLPAAAKKLNTTNYAMTKYLADNNTNIRTARKSNDNQTPCGLNLGNLS